MDPHGPVNDSYEPVRFVDEEDTLHDELGKASEQFDETPLTSSVWQRKKKLKAILIAGFLLLFGFAWWTAFDAAGERVVFSTPVVPLPVGTTTMYFGPLEIQTPIAFSNLEFVLQDDFAFEMIHHILLKRKRGSRCVSTSISAPTWRGGTISGETILAWAKATNAEPLFPNLRQLKQYLLGSFKTPNQTAFTLENENECLYFEVHFEVPEGQSIPNGAFAIGLAYKTVAKSVSSVTELGVAEIAAVHFLDPIPAQEVDSEICVRCAVSRDFNIVAFRNHGHNAARNFESTVSCPLEGKLGQVLVEGNTQQPQIFAALNQIISLEKGCSILLECHYNTMDRLYPTPLGGSPTRREMCNQYLMYFPFNRTEKGPLQSCETVTC